MMNQKALAGLGRILELSDPKDVKLLEMKTVHGMPRSKSMGEAIADILKYTEIPVKLLRQQTIKKAILNEYLREIGIPDSKDLPKDDCIRSCLERWNIEDDSLQKYRTEDEIQQALNRLEAQKDKKIEDIKSRYKQKMKPLLDSLRAIQRRSSDSKSWDASSTVVSPSSSTQTKFSFPKEETSKTSLKRYKMEDSSNDDSIITKKRAKISFRAAKVENLSVTPDIKPDLSTKIPRLPTPDSSDTATSFWVKW